MQVITVYILRMNAIKPASAGNPAGVTAPKAVRPNLRVLVVDDEPLICRLNTDILAGAGYQVDVAENGAAAWDALQRKDYDLLVTDNQMPNLSGVDLVKKVRTAGMSLPVIMATGTLPEEEFTQHLWLYPFVMLLKPYSLAELLETVKAMLHATINGCRPMAIVPNWESHPLVFGKRLT